MSKQTILALFLITIVMVMGFASANLGTFKQNSNVSIRVLANCSVNLNEVTSPTQTFTINSAMNNLGGQTYNYTFYNTSDLGTYTYSWSGSCLDCASDNCGNSFVITKQGMNNGGDNLEIFTYILFIIATLGLFVTLILTLIKLVTSEETIFGIMITWSFLILMILCNYLGQTYVTSTFVENLSSTFVTITIWSNGVLPLISLIVSIFIRSTQKKKVLSPQEITGTFNFNGGMKR